MLESLPEPVACPYLGLSEDDRTRFLFATTAHRCHVDRRPAAIDLDHQGRYCLSSTYGSCPRFRTVPSTAPVVAAVTPPRSVISVMETARPITSTTVPVPPSAAVARLRQSSEAVSNHRGIDDVLKPVAEAAGRQAEAEPTSGGEGTIDRRTGSVARRIALVLVLLITVAALLFVVARPAVLSAIGFALVSGGASLHHVDGGSGGGDRVLQSYDVSSRVRFERATTRTDETRDPRAPVGKE
jgi:hypothetical protein